MGIRYIYLVRVKMDCLWLKNCRGKKFRSLPFVKIWKNFFNHILCIAPGQIDRKIPIIITVNIKYVKEVREQIQGFGGKVIGIV